MNFNPTYPVVLGGLLSNEDNIGYIQVSHTNDYGTDITTTVASSG